MKDNKAQWIANCRSDRAQRIAQASIYVLRVGPPVPNQMQTLENMLADNMVGLYRIAKKDAAVSQSEQNQYLDSCDFSPSPESLKSLLSYMITN